MQIRGMLIFVSCERCMPFILIHPSFASISTMVSCVFFLVSNTSLHSVEFGHDDLLLGFPVFVMKSVPYRASVGFPRWSLVGELRLHRGRLSRGCGRPFLLQMIIDFRLLPDDALEPSSSPQVFHLVRAISRG